jgi:metal-responsive CopG/Arc/MetJ family transcriptional regulator
MQTVTVRLPEELTDDLETEADEQDVSRSECIRETLQDRHEADELHEEISELRGRLDAREERVSELETQLARRSEVEEKVGTLAKREQEGNAPFFVRWYRWWENRDY